jgi:hypothetical protein
MAPTILSKYYVENSILSLIIGGYGILESEETLAPPSIDRTCRC